MGADEPITLPGTGASVWDLLEAPTTLAELVAVLIETYDDAHLAAVKHDVRALLGDLERLGAVTRSLPRRRP